MLTPSRRAPFRYAFLACALLTGCSDPLSGLWEGREDPAVDLDIEADGSDYRGDGHIYLCTSDTCYLCPFDFQAKEDGDDRWEVSGHFTDGCSSAGDFDGVICELQDDILSCDVGGGTIVEYEQRD